VAFTTWLGLIGGALLGTGLWLLVFYKLGWLRSQD
jgi:hypothetical protein